MKSINIQDFTKPDKMSPYIKNRMFSVYLGNSQFYYFTSQKACILFLVNTNRFLNDKYKHINMIYAQAFVEYRKFYIFIESSEHEKQSRKITDNFKIVENSLDLAPASSNMRDGNYHVFSHLLKAIRAIIKSCEIIIEFYKARKHYENIYGLKFIIEQLNIIDYQLGTYGTKTDVNEDIILFD
jgi:hypothetical protein